MAKLPTAYDLGRRPEVRGGRNVIRMRNPGAAAQVEIDDAEKIGRAANVIGKFGAEAHKEAEKARKEEERKTANLEIARARASFMAESMTAAQEITAGEDYASWQSTWNERLTAKRDELAGSFTDDYAREMFVATTADDFARGSLNVLSASKGKEKDVGRASTFDIVENLRALASETKDPVERARILEGIGMNIAASTESGYLSAQEGRKLREGAAKSFGVDVLTLEPDMDKRLAILKTKEFTEIFTPAELEEFRDKTNQQKDILYRKAAAEMSTYVRDVTGVLADGKDFDFSKTKWANLDEFVEDARRFPEQYKVLKDAVEDKAFHKNLNVLPIREQIETVQEMNSVETVDGRENRRLNKAKQNLTRNIQAAQKNPYAYYTQATGNEIIQLDPSDPSTWRDRGYQIQEIERFVGQRVSFFTDAEIAAFKEQIAKGTAKESVGLMVNMQRGMGEDRAGFLASKIFPDDPSLSWTMMTAMIDPKTAEQMLLGSRRRMENKKVGEPSKENLNKVMAEVLGEATDKSRAAHNNIREAAVNIYYSMLENTDYSYDEEKLKEAFKRAAGGDPISVNGRKTLSPVPGMTEEQFEDLVFGEKTRLLSVAIDGGGWATTPYDVLTRFGNGEPGYKNGMPFDPRDLKNMHYVSYGFGIYGLQDKNGSPILLKDNPGEVFKVDLREMHMQNLAAWPTKPQATYPVRNSEGEVVGRGVKSEPGQFGGYQPAVDEAISEYPLIGRYAKDVSIVESSAPQKGGAGEYYSATEKENPNPGSATIAIDPRATERKGGIKRVIIGDMVHHMMNIDPKLKQHKRTLVATMSDREKEFARGRYEEMIAQMEADGRPIGSNWKTFENFLNTYWAEGIVQHLLDPIDSEIEEFKRGNPKSVPVLNRIKDRFGEAR